MKSNTYTIYTDGACNVHTTKTGGWAYAIVPPDFGAIAYKSGGSEDTTSQLMELMAVSKAFDRIPFYSTVHVKTDSMYVVKGFDMAWTLKANLLFWEYLRNQVRRKSLTVIMEWIRRNSEPLHAKVDQMAKHAAKKVDKDSANVVSS